MRKWLVIAALLIISGLIVFVIAMSANNWDFSKLSTVKYVDNTYQITEDFISLSLKTDTADIHFAPSDDGSCRVHCHELEKAMHSVDVQDGTLTIQVNRGKDWHDYIGINFGTPKITIFLPKAEYAMLSIRENTGDIKIPEHFLFETMDISTNTGDVTNNASSLESMKIKTTTGDIRVANISTGRLDLSVSTGDITVAGVTCESDLKINVSTGDISLKNVIAAERFSIENNTGDVKFTGCDASEIFIKTSTGDVAGSLLSDKIFFAESDTGDVDIPKTTTGGRCEIHTSTGDIEIEIQ